MKKKPETANPTHGTGKGCNSAQQHLRPSLLKAGWLIDGTGGPIQQDVLLQIQGRNLVSIVAGEVEEELGNDFLDCSGCTLLPGMVDAHVHLTLPDPEHRKDAHWSSNAGFEGTARIIRKRLMEHLACGVVAVRDAGDRASHVLRYKNHLLPGAGIPVLLRATGPAWHVRGRYGRLIGCAVDQGVSLAEIMKREAFNVDHIKIINSGLNSLVDFGKETAPQFNAEDLAAAAHILKSRGMPIMVHANGSAPVRDAVNAGCDSIEHGFFMGRENLDLLAAHGTAWVPTGCTMAAYARNLPPGSKEKAVAGQNLEHQVFQISEACKAGVTIVLGTDSGSPGVLHGRSAAMEISAFLDAGMTTQEAVRCATWNGAELLGLTHWTGRLIPDMPATFVVTRGGPERLPGSLEKPLAVYVRGVRQVSVF